MGEGTRTRLEKLKKKSNETKKKKMQEDKNSQMEKNNPDVKNKSQEENVENLFNKDLLGDDKDEIPRTYKLSQKHIDMLRILKVMDKEKTFSELIKEGVELLWETKYRK